MQPCCGPSARLKPPEVPSGECVSGKYVNSFCRDNSLGEGWAQAPQHMPNISDRHRGRNPKTWRKTNAVNSRVFHNEFGWCKTRKEDRESWLEQWGRRRVGSKKKKECQEKETLHRVCPCVCCRTCLGWCKPICHTHPEPRPVSSASGLQGAA
jgi:hypothetical protein